MFIQWTVMRRLYWFILDLFPAARDATWKSLMIKPQMPISFDQILNLAFYWCNHKEENVYGDREIKDYMKDNARVIIRIVER
jgi:hypothetical protein